MNDITAETARPTVRVSRHLNFSPERVFRAWTSPALLIRWFGGGDDRPREVSLDPRPGGAYSIVFSPTSRLEGLYRDVDPPRCLVFTWIHVSTLDDGAEKRTLESLVTITLRPTGGGTDLVILHEKLTDEDGRAGVNAGWIASVEKLETLLREET
jgi:uncharacterized protein YndB with AHSA1/START domain